tara:strand:- start:894 stop:1466 length:573 start_codon:yes stop_codon:yes gene_type:complete
MPTSKQDKILKRAIKRSDIYSVITQLAAFGQLNKKYKSKSKKLIRKTAKFGIMAISNLATKGAALASKGAALTQAAKGAALAQVAPFAQVAQVAEGALAGAKKKVAPFAQAAQEAQKKVTAFTQDAQKKGAEAGAPTREKDEEQEVSTTTPTAATPVTPVTSAPPLKFGKKKAVRKSKSKGKSGRRGGRV